MKVLALVFLYALSRKFFAGEVIELKLEGMAHRKTQQVTLLAR